MTENDVQPLLPVKALMIGGPMHGKRLNLPADALEKGHTVTESNMHAHHIPTSEGYHESKYVVDHRVKSAEGELTLFVHETVKDPDNHRRVEQVKTLRERNEKLNKELLEQRVKANDAMASEIETRIELKQAQDKLARIGRLQTAVSAVIIEINDAL